MTKFWSILLTVLAVIATVLVLSACGSNTASVPKCKPHASGCKQTVTSSGNDSGTWIPLIYYNLLFRQQGLSSGSTPVYRSTIPSSEAPDNAGVPDDELQPTPDSSAGSDESSGGESDPSASGSDESSAGSDESGVDDSGGDDVGVSDGGDE